MTKKYPSQRLFRRMMNFRSVAGKAVFSILFCLALVWGLTAWTTPKDRTFKISGKVTDETGEALIGATVLVKDTKIGTVTDLSGEFTLDAPDSCLTLVVSFVGYFQLERENSCAGSAVLLALEPAGDLDEIVVTGYGIDRKTSVSGTALTASPTPKSRRREHAAADFARSAPPPPPPPPVEYEIAYMTTSDVRPKGVPASEGAVASSFLGKAGTLTAGEVNDYTKWDLWSDVSGEDLAEWRKFWGIYPQERYTLQLSTPTGSPAVDYPVRLTDNAGNMIWQTRSDNTGKAELWAGLFDGESGQHGRMQLTVETQNGPMKVDNPSDFHRGLNFIRIDDPCQKKQMMDIAFVVDATGSMQDEIDYLKAELSDVISRVKDTLPEMGINLGSVFYRDQREEYLTRKSDFSTDIQKTLGFMNAQMASGGGDNPEAVEAALQVAVEELTWQPEATARLLFLVLDAPPHRTDQILQSLENTVRLAAQKGIRIIPVACSGTDKSTEYLMRSLALATNGTYTFLTNDSGIGNPHIEPTTDKYDVEKLNALLARVIFNFGFTADCESFVTPQAIAARDTAVVDYPEIKPDDNDIAQADPVSLRIFPNPTSGPLTLEVKGDAKEAFLADFSGKILAKIPLEYGRTELNIGQYPAGTYYLKLLRGKEEGAGGRVVLVKG